MLYSPDNPMFPGGWRGWFTTLGLVFVAIIVWVVVLSLIGCASPSEPHPTAEFHTAHGRVAVITNGNDFDPGAAASWLEGGYARAAAVQPLADAKRLDGLVVIVHGPGWTYNGAPAGGAYEPWSDTAHIQAGNERVLGHELFHRLCWQLGHSGDCCTLADHGPGYDLNCRATP